MIGAISALSTLLIAFWYFRMAERSKRPVLSWVAVGVTVYYTGFLIWMHGVLRPLLGAQFKEHHFWLGVGMDLTAVLAGVALAAWVRHKIMSKSSPAS